MQALIAQRANVNAAEPDGMTALHWAVRANDVPTAQLLMRAGANVKAASRYGITPLIAGRAERRSRRSPTLLLKAGADANARLPEGETVADDGGPDRQLPTSSSRSSRTAPRSTPRSSGRDRRR